GGIGDDVITVLGTSTSTLELDGGAGSDLYNLFAANPSTQTRVFDSGANDDGTIDTIKVNVGTNGYANLKPEDVDYNLSHSRLWFTNSIESVIKLSNDPNLNIIGNGVFRVSNDSVLFNGATYSLAGVTDLTITTTGDGSTIQVNQFPSTLKT